METPKPQEKFELYNKLPATLKDAIWDEKNADILINISRAQHIETREGLLAELAGNVLLGILPIQKFRATIQEELQIPEEQARQIAYEIRDNIFAPVADDLRKLHNLERV